MTFEIQKKIDGLYMIEVSTIRYLYNYVVNLIRYYLRFMVCFLLDKMGYIHVYDLKTMNSHVFWNGATYDMNRYENESGLRFYLVTFYSQAIKYRTIIYCHPERLTDNLEALMRRPTDLDHSIFTDVVNLNVMIGRETYSERIRGWSSNLTIFHSEESKKISRENWIQVAIEYHLRSISIDFDSRDLKIDIMTLDGLLDSLLDDIPSMTPEIDLK